MRILLSENRKKVRSALKQLLEQEPELSVVGEAAEVKDLLIQMQEIRPDLVLLDWELPGLQPTTLLSILHSLYRPLKVIAIGGTREARQAALDAGADAFISKEDPLEWLLITLHRIGGFSLCFAD
jgi:DNA-binding NarL/FixJ family response regulator